jgi:hypothetical protein
MNYKELYTYVKGLIPTGRKDLNLRDSSYCPKAVSLEKEVEAPPTIPRRPTHPCLDRRKREPLYDQI